MWLRAKKTAPQTETGVLLNQDNPWGPSTPPRQEPRRPLPPRPQRRPVRGGNGGGLPPYNNPLSRMMGGNENSGRLIFTVIAVLILVWIASGLYRVLPEENAVVLRFGEYTQTIVDPGLHYHLPWPVENILKPNVTFERRIEVGYRGTFYSNGEKQDIPEESLMLTGDANIVNLDFVVQWKISDAKQFLFNIRDPEGTLKRVSESAMREVVGQNNLQDIITDRRADISASVKKIMQETMNFYNSGITISQVLIQDAGVPAPVAGAYEDVRKASQDAETMRNQGLRYRNEIVPRAQGDAIRMVKEAEAYKERVVAEAKGDSQRFIDIYSAYDQARDVTRERLYIEALEQVLKNSNTIILDSNGKSGTVPYLNLNELRTRKTQESEQ